MLGIQVYIDYYVSFNRGLHATRWQLEDIQVDRGLRSCGCFEGRICLF
jgi:hypothetical protein